MKSNHSRGFSLIELSIVMVISGLIIAAVVSYLDIMLEKKRIEDLKVRIETVQEAIADFQRKNRRLPCPAPIDIPPTDPLYGREVVCDGAAHAGTTLANGRDGMRVRTGALPARTLDIPDIMMQDLHNRKFTYAVVELLADADRLNDPEEGAITITDDTGDSVLSIDGIARYILIAHGNRAGGAYSIQGGLIEPCNLASSEGENCDGDTEYIASNLSEGNNAAYYDDKVAYMVTPAINSAVGWIKPEPQLYTVRYGDDIMTAGAYPPDWEGPQAVCEMAGYKAFTGACRGMHEGYKFNGIIWSNYSGRGEHTKDGVVYWSVTCGFGSNAFVMNDTVEFLCVK